ncbi:MAG: phosphoribosylformylglycinamidine synthase subunit PurQ, partial [Chloroflexi bacterium]|nr:phosphoribosylformylglycinamidine synthase subunit PurQ [Chloroflexota bacterium]
MKFGVIVFPGSNGDHDCYHTIRDVLHEEVFYIWHKDLDLSPYDCLILPGGFSYGDYLRAGAIARFSPVMSAVEDFAAKGKFVLGICNGFQTLTEAHLLPGALMRNNNLQFRCQWVHVRVENSSIPFTSSCQRGQVLHLPIAHGEGSFFAEDATLAELEANGQIVVRYCTPEGHIDPTANPNGSRNNIAGICNRA